MHATITGGVRSIDEGVKTVMQNVLALAELSAELETQGFLGIISGNSNDSNNCGSHQSEGC